MWEQAFSAARTARESNLFPQCNLRATRRAGGIDNPLLFRAIAFHAASLRERRFFISAIPLFCRIVE